MHSVLCTVPPDVKDLLKSYEDRLDGIGIRVRNEEEDESGEEGAEAERDDSQQSKAKDTFVGQLWLQNQNLKKFTVGM